MSLKNKLYGIQGEALIEQFLIKKGFSIKDRNYIYKNNKGEIDIIAYKEGIYIFVEVKTRKNDIQRPHEFITEKKKQSIITTASYYCIEKHIDMHSAIIRFDLACVYNNDINYFENVFTKDY